MRLGFFLYVEGFEENSAFKLSSFRTQPERMLPRFMYFSLGSSSFKRAAFVLIFVSLSIYAYLSDL